MIKRTTINKKIKVGIILANCKGNLGDFAILHGMINYFQSKYTIDQIDIYPDPSIHFSRSHYNTFEKKVDVSLKVKEREETPSHTTPKWVIPFERLGRRVNIRKYFLEKAIVRHGKKSINNLSDFDNYDIIAVAGGGLWGARTITKFGLLYGLHERNNCVVCFPFTAAWPMWISNTSESIKKAFSSLDHVPYVREELTKKRFSDIGMEALEMPDTAFTLASIVREIDSNENGVENKLMICVTNRTKVPKRFKSKVNESSFSHTNNDEVISDLIRKLKKLYNPELISSCPVEDKEWMQRIFQSDKNTNMHFPSSWQEFCAEIKSSDCLITNRLHGAILGLMSGIPVILVTDSDKTIGFAKSYPEIPSIKQLSDLNTVFIDEVLNQKKDLVETQRNLVENSYQKLMNLEFQCLKNE